MTTATLDPSWPGFTELEMGVLMYLMQGNRPSGLIGVEKAALKRLIKKRAVHVGGDLALISTLGLLAKVSPKGIRL
jgi:hypothetical protein